MSGLPSQFNLHFDPEATCDGGYPQTCAFWRSETVQAIWPGALADAERGVDPRMAFLVEAIFHVLGEAEHEDGLRPGAGDEMAFLVGQVQNMLDNAWDRARAGE